MMLVLMFDPRFKDQIYISSNYVGIKKPQLQQQGMSMKL
jgi:hypothetical protein